MSAQRARPAMRQRSPPRSPAPPRKEVVYMQSVAIEGPPCEAMSPHGYFGIEAATVERIAEWIGATTGR